MTFHQFRYAALAALFLFFLPLNAEVTPPPITVSTVVGPRGNTAFVDRRHQSKRWSTVSHVQLSRTTSASSTASGGSGVIETLAGAVPYQQPQTALTADLGSITGITTDTKGNTFVAAENFRSVLKIDSAGNYRTCTALRVHFINIKTICRIQGVLAVESYRPNNV